MTEASEIRTQIRSVLQDVSQADDQTIDKAVDRIMDLVDPFRQTALEELERFRPAFVELAK